MVSIIVPIRIIDFEGILRWTLATCRLQTAIRYWPVFLSIDTMLLIAIERHVAVVRPLNFKRFVSRKNVFFQLVTVWLVSLVQVSYLVVRSKVRGVRKWNWISPVPCVPGKDSVSCYWVNRELLKTQLIDILSYFKVHV